MIPEYRIMPHRSQVDIMAKILTLAKNEISKTHIMYMAFLSHTQMMDYLAKLQKHDYLSLNEKTGMFKTTEKGKKFLDSYENMQKHLPDDPDDEPFLKTLNH